MYQLLRKRVAGKKGFTLIELIVVIAVIAILAVILIPRFTGFTEDARKKAALTDARNVLMALEALEAEGKFSESLTLTEIGNYLGKTITDGALSGLDE
ncbi:MAG TPA: prepilin-type N-terminal cleavage/methylation domain-containing protein, partial [Papillibacter sp.]|nr:prepilin-type N-terminal cleavage/methylation domain-containing protein [Papillibacter sp.]